MATSGRKTRVYWDSCVWIRLINGEAGHELCQLVIDRARKAEVEIWTSTLTLAEVYKFKGGAIEAAKDEEFEDYIDQDFVKLVQVDQEIAYRARRLCRKHDKLKKANDGVHLACAVIHNLDELHTTDRNDLLRLNGEVYCDNGQLLPIILPPAAGTGETLPLLGGSR